MKFYVINLERCKERLAHVREQFAKFGCAITPVKALDGRALTEAQAGHYRQGRYPLLLKDDEIACFLSHRRCWEIIAEGKEEYAFIFEDDVHLSSLFPAFLQSKIWEKTPGILSLEQFYPVINVVRQPILQHPPFAVYRCTSNNPGAAGYVISKKFARILLEHSEVFYHLVDSFLFSPRRLFSCLYGSYQLNPAVCIQGRKNEDFAAKHYVHPTTMRDDEKWARQSLLEKKDLRFYKQRAKIYLHFLKDKLLQKKLRIDFVE